MDDVILDRAAAVRRYGDDLLVGRLRAGLAEARLALGRRDLGC